MTIRANTNALEALTIGSGDHNQSASTDISQHCQDLLRSERHTFARGGAARMPADVHFCQERAGTDPTANLPQEARDYLRDTLHLQSANLDDRGRVSMNFDRARYHNFGADVPPVWFDRSVTGNATVGDNNVRLAGIEGAQVRPPYSPLYVYVTEANFVRDGDNYYADVTAGIGAHATVRVPITREIYDQVRTAATSNRRGT